MSEAEDEQTKRLEELKKEDERLGAEMEALRALVMEQTSKEATEKIKKQHIEALHEYNEVKDATQVVLGVLANHEQVTVKQMHLKYDLPTKTD